MALAPRQMQKLWFKWFIKQPVLETKGFTLSKKKIGIQFALDKGAHTFGEGHLSR